MSEAQDRTLKELLALYEEVAPSIYAWARLHIDPSLRRLIDPDDILQEAWFRSYQRFSTFDPEAGSFRGWLFGIAHNVLRESFRRLKMRGESVFIKPGDSSHGAGIDAVAAEATNLSTRLAEREDLQLFLERLDGLPDEDRKLLLYRGLEGLPHEEVAERLGVSAATAGKRWQRLRTRLRKEGIPPGVIVA